MLQEWWGLNENMRALADRFASSGHTTLVPDLYRGKATSEASEAAHLMAGLDWNAALEDVRTAASVLREWGCERVAVLGFCMGGALALAAACKVENIDGGAYGLIGCD